MNFVVEDVTESSGLHTYSHADFNVAKAAFDEVCAKNPERKYRLICVLATSVGHLPIPLAKESEPKPKKK